MTKSKPLQERMSEDVNPADTKASYPADVKASYFPDAMIVQAALEAAKIGVWYWDIASDKVTWSSNLEGIHRLPGGSFDGTFAFVQNDVHPDDRAEVYGQIQEAL